MAAESEAAPLGRPDLLDVLPRPLVRTVLAYALSGSRSAVANPAAPHERARADPLAHSHIGFDTRLRGAVARVHCLSRGWRDAVRADAPAVAEDALSRGDFRWAAFAALTLVSMAPGLGYGPAATADLLCTAVAARLEACERVGESCAFGLRDARRAARLRPGARVLALLGRCLATFGRFTEARGCFELALRAGGAAWPGRGAAARAFAAAARDAWGHREITLRVTCYFDRGDPAAPSSVAHAIRTDAPLGDVLRPFEEPHVTITELRLLDQFGRRLDAQRTAARSGLADGDEVDIFLEQPDPRLIAQLAATRVADAAPGSGGA